MPIEIVFFVKKTGLVDGHLSEKSMKVDDRCRKYKFYSQIEFERFYRKEHKLNVQYAPTVPTIRPSKGQGELTCLTDSNPEPTYMWKLPNGQVTSGTTIKLMVTDC